MIGVHACNNIPPQTPHPNIGAIAAEGSYTENSLPMHIIDLNCTGREQRLFDCPHNALVGIHSCGSGYDASIRCQGLI